MEKDQKVYSYDSKKKLVDSEVKEQETLFQQREEGEKKQRRLLASEIGKMAVDFDLNLAIIACEFVVQDTWDQQHSQEVILAQVESYYHLSKIHITRLDNEGFQIAFSEPKRKEENSQHPALFQ